MIAGPVFLYVVIMGSAEGARGHAVSILDLGLTVFWVLKCSSHKLSAFGCFNNLFLSPQNV